MESRSSHLSELECHGAIVNLLWSDVAVLDNSTADIRNFIASLLVSDCKSDVGMEWWPQVACCSMGPITCGSTCMDSITSLACHMPVEDTQSTNFIMQNLPELLFADVQTDSLQYGQVSSSAPIKPPHDLDDTETEKLKNMKRQKSAQSKRTPRCYIAPLARINTGLWWDGSLYLNTAHNRSLLLKMQIKKCLADVEPMDCHVGADLDTPFVNA
ncbi:hypothetical protein C8R44DRAFT_744052 [Mycena epipterygia]|nr:hypothetical protein C8R44DRAFT_744052 [Mycena epipterygia]